MISIGRMRVMNKQKKKKSASQNYKVGDATVHELIRAIIAVQ